MEGVDSHRHASEAAAATMQQASSDFSFLALNGGPAAAPEADPPMNGAVAAAPETVKKRKRKSRKGLEKRFECQVEGCGKSYSRAEHLQRHQLNHGSAQTFHCEFPDCSRTFVRADLLKRHIERHSIKGNPPGRRNSNSERPTDEDLGSQTPYDTAYSANSPEALPSHHQDPLQAHVHLPDSVSHLQNVSHALGMPQIGNTGPQMASTPVSAVPPMPNLAQLQHKFLPLQQVPEVTPQQQIPGYGFHSPQYPHQNGMTPMTPSTVGPDMGLLTPNPASQSNPMMLLDPMGLPGAEPVFGVESGLHKSPAVGMPGDFMAYLFNSLPENTASGSILPPPTMNYGDLSQNQYDDTDVAMGNTAMGYFPTGPQQVMAVGNLLEPAMPEASVSEERSQEVFDFIKDRFHGNENALMKRLRNVIIAGDRTKDDHMLSRAMMQAYIWSFWYHFSAQMPIVHRPTFSPDTTPMLLLLAMMTIGAACLDKTHGPEVTMAGARVSNFLAAHLRWETFMDPNFRPPAKLWVFQTLILLELYEKMCSTRELHERAHIHHATTITLMRRGRSLTGQLSTETSGEGGPGSRQSSISGPINTTDEWWNQWIVNESTRRVACAAFVIDSIHATMFGHSVVMLAHEMRLPLPCDDTLWAATSGLEVRRLESNLATRDIKPISFLEGLKRTLSNQEIETTSFGRTILMAGLLNVTYHMSQRDLQVNVLGGNVLQTAAGRDKWQVTLTRAYDSWKADFDNSLERDGVTQDPYRREADNKELSIIFESRTVLHHLAHMAMHADILDCQVYAHAKRLLGRAVGSQEFNAAQRRIKDFWAPSARARDATYYALKFLRSVLAPDQAERRDRGTPQQRQPYETRHDVLLNRPWVLYFAALVIWSYGFAIEGPSYNVSQPATPQEKWMQMRGYLGRYASVSDPNELRSARGINGSTPLLMVLKDSFENSRWELLHEAANLLQNCIILSAGGTAS